MKTADQAHLALTQATLLAIDIHPALRALDQAQAGWPTQTPMAGPAEPGDTPEYTGHCHELDDDNNRCNHRRPCPVHDTAVKLTTPEAGSIRRDKARNDLDRLKKAIDQAQRNLRIATDIAHTWGTVRVDDTRVKTRLAAIDNIWCTNCAQHGHMNPKRQGGTVCDYCAGFKSQYSQYKTYPPKGVLDIWATRGKVLPTDVHRVMRDLKTRAKQNKREEKDPNWRTKPDSTRQLDPDNLSLLKRREKRLTA